MDEEWEEIDCCPRCLHARDEQSIDLPEMLHRLTRRVLRLNPSAAMCGSREQVTDDAQGHYPCSCRNPFHGS